MPQVSGTTYEDSGSKFTTYTGSVNTTSQSFTFSEAQNGMAFRNKGDSPVTLTINGTTYKVPPKATIEIDDQNFSSFDAITLLGTQDFEIKAFKLKSSLENVNTQLTEIGKRFNKRPSKNLFNKDTRVLGNYLNHTTGLLMASASYDTSDYIPITSGQNYAITANRKIAYYDSNKVFHSGADNGSITPSVVTAPVNGFMRVSFATSAIPTAQVEKGIIQTNYQAYGEEKTELASDIIVTNSNPLYGKSILNLGDSIAYGAGSNGIGYADLIANKNSMAVFDYSQSGATIADYTATDPARACVQLKLNAFMTANPSVIPDYILLEGGANDMTLTPVGTVTAWDYTPPYVTTEFCGGLESILSTLITNYPSAKIVFVTTHKLNSRTTTAQDTFYPKMIEVMNKWGIPVVDVYKEGRLNTLIDSLKTNYVPDGTHPNEEGYSKFYVPMVEAKMKAV